MPEWLSDFASPKWWASAFAAGIIMNMLSRRLDDRLVRAAQGAKHWWSDRAQLRAMSHEQAVDELVRNGVARASVIASAIHWSFLGLISFLCGLAFMLAREAILGPDFPITVRVGFLLFMPVIAITSFVAIVQVIKASELLREAATRARTERLDADNGED